MSEAKALVVDDEPGIRFVLERALRAAGLDPLGVGTLAEAREAIRTGTFACAFTDIRLPDGDGLDLAAELAALPKRPLLVVITAQDTVRHAIEAMRRGADEYLVKPFAIADVQALARTAADRVRFSGTSSSTTPVSNDNAGSEAEGAGGAAFGLIGRSASMREVYKRIGRVAATDLPVLVEGESGTGKELVARAIHAASPRASGPFVALNLAALPADLVESELYGHEKGAFTGAATMRPGHFELARGGTLLLDEVGEMPLAQQAKLLRVLQEGEFSRVGGGRPLRADVRVIAATNVELARAVANGRFRADLYYRLRVLPLRLPPLRERIEDVPALVEHFVKREAPRLRGREVSVTPGAMDALLRHPWPGNVRELENLLRAALVEGSDPSITERELQVLLHEIPSGDAGSWEDGFARLVSGRLGQPNALKQAMDEAESIALRTAMDLANGNQVQAAAMLGIHRNSLRRRLDELGIKRESNS